jgi:epoxyqueuosine reductase QueG
MSSLKSNKVKNSIINLGADIVGIASIDRFDNLPPERHPRSIFPETKSVIVIGRRITRGTLRGVEEGTQFNTYRLYGDSWLEDRFLAYVTYETTVFLENDGWEAVPLPGLPPEIPSMGIAVGPEKPPPNVFLDIEDAAVRAGLGEIGYCGVFLTPEFGPLQRLQAVLTDSELEQDPILQQAICDLCARSGKYCPLGAFVGEHELDICGKKMTIAEIDYSKCRVCKNGAMPNRYYGSARPDRIAAICIRSCLDHLEKSGRIKTRFHEPFRKREPWILDELGRSVRVT